MFSKIDKNHDKIEQVKSLAGSIALKQEIRLLASKDAVS